MTVNNFAKQYLVEMEKHSAKTAQKENPADIYGEEKNSFSRGTDMFTSSYDLPKLTNSSLFYKSKSKSKSSYSFSSSRELTKIATARNQGSVRAISNNLRATLRSLKNSNLDDAQKQKFMSRIKKVIEKAEGKIRNLRSEERIERKRLVAKQIKNNKEAQNLKKKLYRQRTARKNREYSDIMHSSDIMGKSSKGERDMDYLDNNISFVPEISDAAAIVDAAVAEAAVAADAAPVDVAAADIAVADVAVAE